MKGIVSLALLFTYRYNKVTSSFAKKKKVISSLNFLMCYVLIVCMLTLEQKTKNSLYFEKTQEKEANK